MPGGWLTVAAVMLLCVSMMVYSTHKNWKTAADKLKSDRDAAIKHMLGLSDQAFCSDECKEGVRAFLGKEKPQFPRD